MSCSLKTHADVLTPIASHAGVRRRSVPAEPFQRWLELMALIEILSPRWPRRLRSAPGSDWRL